MYDEAKQPDDYRRSFIALRWVVVIATCYLLISERNFDLDSTLGIFFVLAISSNLAVSFLPLRYFSSRYFFPVMAILDILMVTSAIHFLGRTTQDFFIVYFFIIILSALGENLKTVLLAASAVAMIYTIYIFKTSLVSYEFLLRIVFLFTVAMFNGFMVERLKTEKMKKHNLEERLLLEKELRKKDDLFRTLVSAVPDVIYSITSDGKISSLNPAFERVTGWKTEEIIGRPFTDILYPGDIPMAIKLFRNVVFRKHVLPPCEFRVISKSGEYLTGEFSAAPLVEDGIVIGELGVARDISRYKQIEDTMSRHLAAMDASLDGLAILNSDEKYIYLNDAHAKIYGRVQANFWVRHGGYFMTNRRLQDLKTK